GANNSNTGFQNLSLVQNGETPIEGDLAQMPETQAENGGGANEAFLVNGSLSQGVQAQAGDGFGMGGPGGFGFGPGGPGAGLGGPGNPFAGAAGGEPNNTAGFVH